jgi:hypothetical protein
MSGYIQKWFTKEYSDSLSINNVQMGMYGLSINNVQMGMYGNSLHLHGYSNSWVCMAIFYTWVQRQFT